MDDPIEALLRGEAWPGRDFRVIARRLRRRSQQSQERLEASRESLEMSRRGFVVAMKERPLVR